jgi:hypothetical protein
MPKIIHAGKRKSGVKREYKIPTELYGPNEKVMWKEWELKNSYRDSKPVVLFGANGRPIKPNIHRNIFDSRGNVVGGKIKTNFSKRELFHELAIERKKQREKKWLPRRLRNASEVMFKIETIPLGGEMMAMRLITNNPFFREGLLIGKLTFKKDGLSMINIREACEDYFLGETSVAIKSRKDAFGESAKKLGNSVKQIILK